MVESCGRGYRLNWPVSLYRRGFEKADSESDRHLLLRKMAAHALIDRDFNIIITEFPIILQEVTVKGKPHWHPFKVADVIGFKGPEIAWIECGSYEGIRSLLKERNIIEELEAETRTRISLFHLNWKGQLTLVSHIGFGASPGG
jgi:hypothetical protein